MNGVSQPVDQSIRGHDSITSHEDQLCTRTDRVCDTDFCCLVVEAHARVLTKCKEVELNFRGRNARGYRLGGTEPRELNLVAMLLISSH